MRGFAQRNTGGFSQPPHAVVTFQAHTTGDLDDKINGFMEKLFVKVVAISTVVDGGNIFATVAFEEDPA